MAWDMYLNLGARETQSAYHEYFLAVQVEEGHLFTIDQLNFIGNFDTGWYDPFHHELGISLEGMTIGQPYYIPPAEEDESEQDEEEENIEEPDLDTGIESSEESTAPEIELADNASEPGTKSRNCSTAQPGHGGFFVGLLALLFRRKRSS